jgi:hypothetical protein
MTSRWFLCPSCESSVPLTYQIEESFDDQGQAVFDPAGSIGPVSDEQSLAACWLRVIRCPNEECERAWALTLYPTAKSLFDEQVVAFPG